MSVQPSILIVDDEQGILDTLRILLKNEGFDVTTAQGGKAGLEQLKAAAPDLVLTDIKMPGVTGIDILAAAKDQDPETPVILMTAQASLQTAIQAVNQGAFHYVPKPFSNDEIVALCRRAAERSEEHTSELQSLAYLVCRLLLEKKKKKITHKKSTI